jgi:uncharacterized protein (DUF433 family)
MSKSSISRHPDIMSGAYCIRGRRLPVKFIKATYRGGWSIRKICDQYRLKEREVRAALYFRERMRPCEQRTWR